MSATGSPRRHRGWMYWLIALLLSGTLVACGGSSARVDSDDTPAIVEGGPQPIVPTSTPGPTETTIPAPTFPIPSPTATAVLTPSPAATATPAAPTPAPSPSPAAGTAPVIVLDPGHDASRPSALGVEYQDVLRTALITQAALEAAGYRVFLTRTDNETVFVDDPTLLPPNAADFNIGYSHAYAHATKALQFDPDLIIQLHYNGHSNPDVAGVEVYYCENGGEQNLVLAEIVRDELIVALRSIGYETPSTKIAEDLPIARGGRHFPSLGNVYDAPREYRYNRYAGIPVVLTEPLYETNPTERALIEAEATHHALAQAYVRAIDRYFGR